MYTKLMFGLSYIYMVAVFARDGINRVGPLLPQYRVLRFRENVPQCLKRFLINFNVQASQNNFYMFFTWHVDEISTAGSAVILYKF